MEVDRPSVRLGERHRRREPVPDDPVAVIEEEVSHPIHSLAVQDQIEILVLPGLPTDEGVDAPPSVDPRHDACLGDLIEHVEHLIGAHDPMLTASRSPRYGPSMATTRASRHIGAPRAAVYRALLDPDAVQRWMVPDGMSSEVHEFEAREGGTFRVSLTYDAPTTTGKTTEQTDTFHGRFVELVPDEKVVQAVEFESDDPTMQGEMTITYELEDADGGTLVTAVHEDLPDGVTPEANELGWSMSISKLAALVERD
jgi:uncharacterized protein YndB with AHSA1/START domain